MPNGKAFQSCSQVSLRWLNFGRPVGFPELRLVLCPILSHQAQPSRPHFSLNRSIKS